MRQQERSHNGGTLTDPTAAIDPAFGCRPVQTSAAQTLHTLHQRQLRLVLASNNLPNQNRRLALRHAQIEDLFTDVLTSHEFGYGKPDPRFYAAVLDAANCPPAQVLFVGNHRHKDVAAPIRHGMHAVLLRPHGLKPGEKLPAGKPPPR